MSPVTVAHSISEASIGLWSIEWTLDNLGRRFQVFQRGELHEVMSFGEYQNVHFLEILDNDARTDSTFRTNERSHEP
jgi:hypothetical protein